MRDREDGPGSQTLEEEVGCSWGEIERMAQDPRRWRRKSRIGDIGELLLVAYVLVGCKGLGK